jgi:Cytochrome P450
LHVDDPDGDFYHVAFSSTGIRDKDENYTAQFGTPDTGFGAVSHHLHRMRRQALNPFFSKASIVRLQPIIASMIEKLCARIDENKATGQPINMRLAYMCFTTDVMTSYSLNRCWNHLDIPDWSPLWCKTIRETAEMSKWLKQFPWMWKIIKGMPENIVGALNPGLILVLDMQNVSS